MSAMPQSMRCELYRYNQLNECRVIRHRAIADGLVQRGMCSRVTPGSLMLRLTEAGAAWLLDRGAKLL